MVATIRPVVYRDRKLLRWLLASSSHLVGSSVAAAVTGVALGLAGLVVFRGSIRGTLPYGILGGLSLAYALDELRIVRLPNFGSRKQVPASWRALFRPSVAAFFYGLGLGTGVMTRIATGALYVVILGLVFSASPVYAAAAFALFGFTRGASVFGVGQSVRRSESGTAMAAALQRFMGFADDIHVVAGGILAAVGGFWLGGALLLT